MSEHTATEPRWRRLPEERPKQILDAALAVFAERGLSSAPFEVREFTLFESRLSRHGAHYEPVASYPLG